MTRILINATAAKEGGALTIFNQFCAAKKDDKDNFYILVSPCKPKLAPQNYEWIKKSTNGFFTLFFSLFASWFYAKHHRCDEIISFSNVNTVFPLVKKITYFHNLLIIFGESRKFCFLRFIVNNFFQRSAVFIFQTSYVKYEFIQRFKFTPKSKVLWPGVDINDGKLSRNLGKLIRGCGDKFIVPITNIDYEHKNFKLITKYAKQLLNKDITFYVTTDLLPLETPVNVIACGSLSKEEFVALIGETDGVIITSEYETLCLPIFEAIQQDKPAFVLNRDYVKGLNMTFGDIDGLFVFNNFSSLYSQIESAKLTNRKFSKAKYSLGQWDF